MARPFVPVHAALSQPAHVPPAPTEHAPSSRCSPGSSCCLTLEPRRRCAGGFRVGGPTHEQLKLEAQAFQTCSRCWAAQRLARTLHLLLAPATADGAPAAPEGGGGGVDARFRAGARGAAPTPGPMRGRRPRGRRHARTVREQVFNALDAQRPELLARFVPAPTRRLRPYFIEAAATTLRLRAKQLETDVERTLWRTRPSCRRARARALPLGVPHRRGAPITRPRRWSVLRPGAGLPLGAHGEPPRAGPAHPPAWATWWATCGAAAGGALGGLAIAGPVERSGQRGDYEAGPQHRAPCGRARPDQRHCSRRSASPPALAARQAAEGLAHRADEVGAPHGGPHREPERHPAHPHADRGDRPAGGGAGREQREGLGHTPTRCDLARGQSHMLALNAATGARAGEQGRASRWWPARSPQPRGPVVQPRSRCGQTAHHRGHLATP